MSGLSRLPFSHARVSRRGAFIAPALVIFGSRHRTNADDLSFSVTELTADSDQIQAVHARAINRKATAVGIGTGENGPGAVRSRGDTSWLLPIEGSTSLAHAINARGVIAGSIDDFAAIWTDDVATMLAPFGTDRTTAYGINANGIVVGSADKGANQGVALVWAGEDIQELESLGGPSSRATGINDSGVATGYSTIDDSGEIIRAVIWNDHKIHDLGTLGGEKSQALAINNADVVVGCSTSDEGFSAVDHAFLWQGGEMKRLARIESVRIQGREERVKLDRSIALAINDAGDICGASMSASENDPISVATLWLGDDVINLNDTIGKQNRKFHLLSADGINQDREMVCTGYLLDDELMTPRMFRLMPD